MDHQVVPTNFPRTGISVDVHAFATDAEQAAHRDGAVPLWLAGLYWPGERGLSGHSDGDVVAHAAADALFSAAGCGDLGSNFGVDREDMAGASGVRILGEAARIVRQAGFIPGNIAVQLIGQRPKFSPRREEAQQVLSQAAGCPVAVAATTSDHLGFTGRSEGLAAVATALVLPGA
ncbi:2-C-methyl-D-erythritol 2,4-cyclodiphosphate synthase [Kocuria sp.]|uniref:2-C-methyl-D-erythritol 2,4-cyclodiphosphate synthase n=1 Tax=Kocuria sp. TaxID=1871328 RepID=UPI0026E0A1D3|nr:2-C-methyl-D-erythritol 2,4-cyclodiphosphate synthase [Kocuria sp.]MDO5618048.1 2-C-methyl-D-erythritol 2,4-cyclodiphosphate synthase [Kocuria sp.]